MENDNTVIVTGGSGFIGTLVCKRLVEQNFNVINIDRKKKEIAGVTQYPFDLNNHQVKGIILITKPTSIIHLASEHEVARSVSEPEKYYTNNIANTINLLNYALEAGVRNFIYSGSSSVYGNTDIFPTPENTPLAPASPYARTKAMVEDILRDYTFAHRSLKCASLRYFNAAGAVEGHGYTQDPATHLIPIACRKAIRGEILEVYGHGWNTPDRTCERDYTHVSDIADAHIKAIDYLRATDKVGQLNTFNLGQGISNSVLEVIDAVNEASDKNLEFTFVGPRAGDIAKTCADNRKAKEVLGWTPKYNLQDIVNDAYAWEFKHKRKKL